MTVLLWNASYFTLLSFSVSLAWLILTVTIESPLLRGIGERWDVSWGRGLMVYCTLGVHLTEKKLVPGGAHLEKNPWQSQWSTFTNHMLQCKVPAVEGGGSRCGYNSQQVSRWWSDHTTICWCTKLETQRHVVGVTNTDTPVFAVRTSEKLAWFPGHIIGTSFGQP